MPRSRVSTLVTVLAKALATGLATAISVSPALQAQAQPTVEPRGDSEPQILIDLSTTLHDALWRSLDYLPVDVDPALPPLDEGDQLTMRYLSNGKLELTKGKPAPHLLQLRMRPGPVKQRLKEAAGILGGLARAGVFAVFVLEYRGEPRFVARGMKAVTDFPFQIEWLELSVKRRTGTDPGYVIDLSLTPRPGTWFHRVVHGIRPSQRGAHLLRTPHAALSIAAAVEGPGRAEMIAPFAEILANLRGKSKAERRAFRELATERAGQFDGSFSLLIDGPGRYVRLVGLQNERSYAERCATAEAIAFDTRRMGRPDVLISEGLPDALANSRLQLLLKEEDVFETVTDAPEQELATFSGVLRDFGVKVRWPADGVEVARLVERIEKRRLRRLPILEEALLVAELNFGAGRLRKLPRAELVTERIREVAGELDEKLLADLLDGLPEQVKLTIHKRMKGAVARLDVHIETHAR